MTSSEWRVTTAVLKQACAVATSMRGEPLYLAVQRFARPYGQLEFVTRASAASSAPQGAFALVVDDSPIVGFMHNQRRLLTDGVSGCLFIGPEGLTNHSIGMHRQGDGIDYVHHVVEVGPAGVLRHTLNLRPPDPHNPADSGSPEIGSLRPRIAVVGKGALASAVAAALHGMQAGVGLFEPEDATAAIDQGDFLLACQPHEVQLTALRQLCDTRLRRLVELVATHAVPASRTVADWRLCLHSAGSDSGHTGPTCADDSWLPLMLGSIVLAGYAC